MDLRELPTETFKRHPWETTRARFFIRVLRDHVQGSGLSVVDFGSGDGFFAKSLLATWPEVANVICFDPAYLPEQTQDTPQSQIRFVRERPEAPADMLVMLDVLEHETNDQAMLHGALSACLKPGGWVLLSVPAHPLLFSTHDQMLGHKRRYSPEALLTLAQNEDLTIVERGPLFASLLVPRALTRLGEALRGQRTDGEAPEHIETSLGTWNRGPWLTRAVEGALALDIACTRGLRLPIPGLSTWLLARKK
jgi:hypothetical protein